MRSLDLEVLKDRARSYEQKLKKSYGEGDLINRDIRKFRSETYTLIGELYRQLGEVQDLEVELPDPF